MSDIRTILAGELHQLATDLASHASGLRAGSEDAATDCLALCERLGQVANMIETPALQEIALFLMSNVPALLGSESAEAPAALCADLELCLLEGAESARWQALSRNLTDPLWPAAMDSETASEVIQGLLPLSTLEPPTEAAVDCISAADLTLRSPDDVGSETLQAFYHEAPQQAAQLNKLFGVMRGAAAADQLAAAQRLAHTLKGSSALCGLHAIAHLAHAVETVLQSLASDTETLSTGMHDALVEAGDSIEQMIELAAEGGCVPQNVLSLIHRLQRRDFAAGDAEILIQEPPSPVVEEPSETEQTAVELLPTLNVPTQIIDENLRRAGEINIAISQLNSHLSGTLERAARLGQQLSLVQSQVYELETLVDTRGIPAMHLQSGLAGSDFDPLELDQYSALHSLSRAFAESALDSRELSRELSDELLKLQNLLTQHARLGRELTDSVMSTRLVSVSTIAPRLERIVRQVARQTGKQVELMIQGRELSIDTDILNGLVEPLMHALRNAVDHGIETAAERATANKPATGRIELTFKRDGNRIEVLCRDNGRGLDFAAIARRARERNLLLPEINPTDAELAQFIFAPGFSTRDHVTAISGRGVGMDVVRASIEKLKGTVHIDSRAGQGCTLIFRLPLSLTATHALFVGVGDGVYGLPSTGVDQVLYSDAGRVTQFADRFAFEYGGQVYPLHSLAALLGQSQEDFARIVEQPLPLVLVAGDTGPVAIAVERALDSRQIIVKGLSRMLPSLPGVAGACVLPDGGIGVILEIRELLRQPHSGISSNIVAVQTPVLPNAIRALVVDDSLSARRALAQLLTDCGYEVATAIDGLDAVAKLAESTPDVLLVDLEMPRMNGLELAAHVRNKSVTRDVPIVMITSRGAEKHRAQAIRSGVTEFMTKPYQEHELLERVSLLVDRK
jgi:chemosensory pili system protein ChpA (sensor histidine kinase/response regulator)